MTTLDRFVLWFLIAAVTVLSVHVHDLTKSADALVETQRALVVAEQQRTATLRDLASRCSGAPRASEERAE